MTAFTGKEGNDGDEKADKNIASVYSPNYLKGGGEDANLRKYSGMTPSPTAHKNTFRAPKAPSNLNGY